METITELMARRPNVEFAVELSERTLAEFRERGFTSILRITSDEELAWLAEVFDRLFADRANTMPGAYIDDVLRPYDKPGENSQPQILMPELRFPELRKTAFWRNGRALASRFIDVESAALRGWGHMIPKPARVGEALPWHQDEAYWDPAFDYKALGCWMPLDAATHESGCMSFIPGSHRNGVRAHRHLGDDPRVHALFVEDVDPKHAVEVPVAAGGAVFHHCRTLHYSAPNRSPYVRRAWANEWQTEPVKRESPAERPWFDEGRRARESLASKQSSR
jgi:ectoine hydroxylase-related dioxygenase (phytanoyl-CoA dioxygenase family)